jgi:hypothetical protein
MAAVNGFETDKRMGQAVRKTMALPQFGHAGIAPAEDQSAGNLEISWSAGSGCVSRAIRMAAWISRVS